MSSARLRLFMELGSGERGSDVCNAASAKFGLPFSYKLYYKHDSWVEVWSDLQIDTGSLEELLSEIASAGWDVNRSIDGASAVWNQVGCGYVWDPRMRWANVEIE
jgi:hypothetical protein